LTTHPHPVPKYKVPDVHDRSAVRVYLCELLPEIKARPKEQDLIARCHLTDDDIIMLVAVKMEDPFPVYKWLNGFLRTSRGDADVVDSVGPAFTMLYRALEKLPLVTVNASRGAVVKDSPALKSTYDNYEIRLTPGSKLNFWGTSSFTTSSKVLASKSFIGGHGEEAIVYTCGQLTGVDMEPFAPPGLKAEAEILPLPPALFTVTAVMKLDHRVVVTLQQREDAKQFAYVVPNSPQVVP
jgi:hypothetical protein